MGVIVALLVCHSPDVGASIDRQGSPLGMKSGKPIRSTYAADVSAVVARGGEVAVPLRAVQAYGSQISFEIIKGPSHGSVLSLTPTSDHTALLVYRHDGKADRSDRLQFRCQSPGSAKSIPYSVDLKVQSVPARLVFEFPSLNFGSLLLGESRKLSLKVTNRGGERFYGRLVPGGGFSLPGGEEIDLSEGESCSIPVSFSPSEAREYDVPVRLVPEVAHDEIRLRGSGEPRFKASRKGPAEWEFSNSTKDPLRLEFSGAVARGGLSDILLQPESTMSVEFESKKNPLKGDLSTEELRVSDNRSSILLPITTRQSILPPELGFVTPSEIGEIPLGRSVQVYFRVRNPSAQSCQYEATVSSLSGGVSGEKMILSLDPLSTKEIPFPWKPSLPGKAEVKLSLSSPDAVPVQTLEWKAMVINAPRSDPSPSREAVEADLPMKEDSKSPILPDTDVPAIEGIEVSLVKRWFGKTKVVIAWPSGAEKLIPVLDERRLKVTNPDDVALGVMPEYKVETLPVKTDRRPDKDSMGSVITEGVSPGMHLFVLNLAEKDGRVVAASPIQVAVPRGFSLLRFLISPPGLLSIILLIGFILWRRNR